MQHPPQPHKCHGRTETIALQPTKQKDLTGDAAHADNNFHTTPPTKAPQGLGDYAK